MSAEENKAVKYSHLSPSYIFTPLAIKTSGTIDTTQKLSGEMGSSAVISHC